MNTLKFLAALFILVSFISSACAHMELISPKSRGHEESTMSQAPCGGYNDVSATVTDFPITSKNSFLNNIIITLSMKEFIYTKKKM